MITALQAKSIADAVNSGTPVNKTLVDENNITGNLILDELNHAAVWASKEGFYKTYLVISKFSDLGVKNSLDVLNNLGYTVDTKRLEEYKEIMFSWE